MNYEPLVYDHLIYLGLPTHLSGYYYIKRAILMVIDNPRLLKAVTKEVYPPIASESGSTASNVERAIRNAIEYVFNNTDQSILCKYFGNSINPLTNKVSNSQFIASVAEHIKISLMREAK